MGSLTTLEDFLKNHPSIKTYLPTDESFSSISQTFVAISSVPSRVARPQSAEDVAALVSHCVTTSTPFVIRTGGHDLSSRSTVDNVLQIDLRDISHITIADDRKSARLGGGVLMGALQEYLGNQDLVTPTGTVGTVGYVGWATFGGYGPFAPSLGLGCDQILGAKVVLASGEIADADEELLEGIRGAGPALGVVVEVQIKVYPKLKIQAGLVIYPSKDISSTMRSFWPNWNRFAAEKGFPKEVSLQPSVLDLPGMGGTFCVAFVWNGPACDESDKLLEDIAALAPGAMKMVAPTSPSGYLAQITSVIPPRVNRGSSRGVNLRGMQLSPEGVEIFAEYGAKFPGDGTLFSLHQLRGKSVDSDSLPSVFRNREDHFMLEIIGLTATKEKGPEGKEWADAFGKHMAGLDQAMEGGYYSLLPKGKVGMEAIYGEHWETVKRLKAKFDPGNAFQYAFAT